MSLELITQKAYNDKHTIRFVIKNDNKIFTGNFQNQVLEELIRLAGEATVGFHPKIQKKILKMLKIKFHNFQNL